MDTTESTEQNREPPDVRRWERGTETLVVAVFYLLPLAHPFLIPLVGVPSHLLWWAQVLPVALLTYRHGRLGGGLAMALSTVMVVAGERSFGMGYGSPASWETTLSLAVALQLTNVLVVVFALYARASAARYRVLFHRVNLGVIRTREDGRIIEANRTAAEILACSRSELKGENLLGIITHPPIPSMEALEARGAWEGEVEIGTGAQARTLHAFVAGIRDRDAGGFQVLLSDRSVEVLRDRELERKAKLATLGEALAGVAHELKNPLTAIIAQAQLGQMSPGATENTTDALKVVEEQGHRMKEMIGELLGFSRKETDGGETNLHELIPRLVKVHGLALGRSVRLTHTIRWEGRVAGNGTKIEQILLNLISNAGDALSEGGVEDARVRVTLEEEAGQALVVVSDNGPGIPKEVLPGIFQPFVTTKPEGQGTGLGLAISRRLARSMGGDLVASNQTEGGARFILTLPTVTGTVTRPIPGHPDPEVRAKGAATPEDSPA